jgi:hypothetical protein
MRSAYEPENKLKIRKKKDRNNFCGGNPKKPHDPKWKWNSPGHWLAELICQNCGKKLDMILLDYKYAGGTLFCNKESNFFHIPAEEIRKALEEN